MLNLCKSGADAATSNSGEDEVAASASYAYCSQDISLCVRILIVCILDIYIKCNKHTSSSYKLHFMIFGCSGSKVNYSGELVEMSY